MTTTAACWWRSRPADPVTVLRRGGLWVVGQFALGALVALAAGRGPARSRRGSPRRAAGAAILLGGAGLTAAAARRLGPALTPLPQPRPGAPLAATGVYGRVRHPVYAGVLLMALGGATAGSPAAAAPAAALAALLDRKAAREERHLRESAPGYGDYADRVVWRFLPGVR